VAATLKFIDYNVAMTFILIIIIIIINGRCSVANFWQLLEVSLISAARQAEA